MKKAISIVIALAMVFVMSFAVFAEGEDLTPVKPTDPTELGVYYAELLNAEGSDPAAVAAEIVADFQAGLITVETLPTVITAFADNVVDETKLIAALEQVTEGLESLGVTLPTLPTPPGQGGEGNEGEEGDDETLLPDDGATDGSGDLINTILGILGSIGDMIFGSGDDNPTDTEDTWTDADVALANAFAEEFNANGSSKELLAEIAEAITSGEVVDVATFSNAFVDAASDKQAAYDFLKDVEANIQETDPGFVLPIDPPSNNGSLVPNTGDTTVLSVAAVALVAGAALVLTRKKSEDAE